MDVKLGLGTQLRSLSARLDRDIQAYYDEAGMAFRPRFFAVAQWLVRHQSAGVTEIARATGVSQPAATQTIGQMDRLGLLKSSPATDGRERCVSLSERGLDVVGQLEGLWAAIERAAKGLEAELPAPLSQTLAAANASLDREGFAARIRRELTGG